MYGRIFRSIYDGTLADNWQALVTFQQLLVLCDQQGIVDMTPGAISRTTGIPLDIIGAGLAALEAPDPASRTPTEEGRRVARLDDHRDWGWRIVNFAAYRAIRSAEDKRQADRVRIARKRADSRDNERRDATPGDTSTGVAEVAHTALAANALSSSTASADDGPDPIFGYGLALLTSKGIGEKGARSFLGKLRRDIGDLPAIELLTRCEAEDISDPLAWLTKAAKTRTAQCGRATFSSPDKATDL